MVDEPYRPLGLRCADGILRGPVYRNVHRAVFIYTHIDTGRNSDADHCARLVGLPQGAGRQRAASETVGVHVLRRHCYRAVVERTYRGLIPDCRRSALSALHETTPVYWAF